MFALYLCPFTEVKTARPGILSWLQHGTPVYFCSMLRGSGNSKSSQMLSRLVVVSSVLQFFC